MAIVQISRIQIRRGLNQDLPQLVSAEMAWSVDTQQLYIGNGTIAEGAPNTGVTEILTTVSLDQLTSSFAANLAQLQANLTAIQSNVSVFVNNIEANLSSYVANLEANLTSVTVVNLAASSSGSITGFSPNNATITYSLNQGTVVRTGTIVASRISSTAYYTDDYVETGTSDIVLGVTANSTQGNLYYTTVSPTTLSYSIKSF